MGEKPRSLRKRLLTLAIGVAVYVALLVASRAVESARPAEEITRPQVMLPEFVGAEEAPGGRRVRVTYLEWEAERPPDQGSRPAVLLLHGSPGDASNFQSGTFADGTMYRGLGERLAARGYRVIAPDVPGFGQSEKWIADYSIEAHAAYCLALMDALGIERFHAVGWSMGGGVVLHLADMAPDRVASATLMASIGTQESEGSGDYWFEHFKYAVGYAGLVVGVDLVPHFGVLPERWFRHSSMRNFLDTDMRSLRRILAESRVPLLVLHGRYDVLAGVRGAAEAAALSPRSRLVVNGANHFLPIAQAEEMEGRLAWLFARHDVPGVEPLAGVADLAPAANRVGADAFVHWLGRLTLGVAWWVTALAIALLASRRPRATMVLCTLVITTMTLDFGVAAIGVLGGWAWHERRERGAWGMARLLLWVPIAQFVLLIAAWQVVMPWVEGLSAGGMIARGAAWVVLVVCIIAGASLVAIVPEVWTWRGRRRLLASWSRLMHHEWWPASVFYLPVWAWLAWLSLRHGGPLVFTCANPGIPGGGGIIGESKSQILDALGDAAREFALPVRFIEAGASPAERAARALAVIRGEAGEAGHRATGGGANPFAFPVILKPDMAYRGFAMKLARRDDDVRAYFEAVTSPVIVQAYHPGPEECGLFWIRTPRSEAAPASPDSLHGRVFAVTRKRFPYAIGDGRRTLERLILDDRRLRCQWRVFFTRHKARLREVVPAGERVRLAQAGNHAQGTLFLDGADLITPQLEAAVDRVCDSFRGADGAPYDFGRLDVRYESDDLLRQGRSLAIVELNGSTSEATNLYDPSFSLLRSYRVLFAQWARLYELGVWRKKQGHRGVTIRELVGHWFRYRIQRTGSSIAD